MMQWEVTSTPISIVENVNRRINYFSREYYGVDLSLLKVPTKRYITARGTKLTKLLEKRLRAAGVSKKELQEHWAGFCKSVRSLYGEDLKVFARFNDPYWLGEGLYDNGTCYRDGSNNHRSKHCVSIWNRAHMLTLEKLSGKVTVQDCLDHVPEQSYGHYVGVPWPAARCIVVNLGKRHLYLTNFYFRNFPNNHHLFIQALEQRYKTEFVRVYPYTIDSKYFPLSRNGDGRIITDKRGIKMIEEAGYEHWVPGFAPASYSVSCPSCSKHVRTKHLYHERSGATYYFGCDHEHGHRKPNQKVKCQHCRAKLEPQDEIHPEQGGGPYCRACVEAAESCWRCGALEFLGIGITRRTPVDSDHHTCSVCKSALQREGQGCVACSKVWRHAKPEDWVDLTIPLLDGGAASVSMCPHCHQTQVPVCAACNTEDTDSLRKRLHQVRAGGGGKYTWRLTLLPPYAVINQRLCGRCYAKHDPMRVMNLYEPNVVRHVKQIEKRMSPELGHLVKQNMAGELLREVFDPEGLNMVEEVVGQLRKGDGIW